MKLKRYDKSFDHSYTIGLYPTIELLEARPDVVLRIVTHSKFTSADGRRQLADFSARHTVPLDENDRLIEKLSPRSECLVLAVFRKYTTPIDPQADHVVLVNPANAGNLGTVVRSMLAFGFHDLAVIEPAADLFSPTTIRSSMGALFGIRFEHFTDIDAYRAAHQAHGLYPFMTRGRTDLAQTAFAPPYALVFGNESSGLPDEFAALGEPVRIAQSPDVDSLNLAISTGIALYHLYRSRHAEVENQRHVPQT
jgi:TrmH family RNA methyltransferase